MGMNTSKDGGKKNTRALIIVLWESTVTFEAKRMKMLHVSGTAASEKLGLPAGQHRKARLAETCARPANTQRVTRFYVRLARMATLRHRSVHAVADNASKGNLRMPKEPRRVRTAHPKETVLNASTALQQSTMASGFHPERSSRTGRGSTTASDRTRASHHQNIIWTR